MISMKVDTKQFSAALNEYLKYTKKDVSEVLNSKAGDIALRAASVAPSANRMQIASLQEKGGYKWPMWPKFINKLISHAGFTLHSRRKAKTDAERNVEWIETPTVVHRYGKTSYVTRFGRKSMGQDKVVNRDNARVTLLRKVSKTIIKRRIATINAMKAVFGIVALEFGKPSKFERKGRLFKLPTKKATVTDLMAFFILKFASNRKNWPGGTKPNASQDVAGKYRIAVKALHQGINFVVRDMEQYIAKKLQARGQQASGRVA